LIRRLFKVEEDEVECGEDDDIGEGEQSLSKVGGGRVGGGKEGVE